MNVAIYGGSFDPPHVAHLFTASYVLATGGFERLLVVPVFVLSNLFEWWIHKNVMHRLVDVWALRAIYDRTHSQVLAVANKVGMPVIDLSTAFPDVPASEAAQNMPYFYPYPAHYTPEGYRHAGQFILQSLAAQDSAK